MYPNLLVKMWEEVLHLKKLALDIKYELVQASISVERKHLIAIQEINYSQNWKFCLNNIFEKLFFPRSYSRDLTYFLK